MNLELRLLRLFFSFPPSFPTWIGPIYVDILPVCVLFFLESQLE